MKNIIHRISKIISTAIFVILIMIIAVILFYIFRVNYMTKHDRLGEIRFNIYTILTQSMYPTIEAGDVVIGLAASGRTPYVIGGLEYAKEIGCKTACIVCFLGGDLFFTDPFALWSNESYVSLWSVAGVPVLFVLCLSFPVVVTADVYG